MGAGHVRIRHNSAGAIEGPVERAKTVVAPRASRSPVHILGRESPG